MIVRRISPKAQSAAVLVAVFGLVSPGVGSQAAPAGRHVREAVAPDLPSGFFDVRTFSRSLAAEWSRPPAAGRPKLVIVPHHWLAGSLITGGLRDLLEGAPVQRVIVIGPNHSGAGNADVATSERSWSTPFGRAVVDDAAVDELIRRGIAGRQPDVLIYEHSIAGLVPAVASFAPRAELVPLAVRAGITRSAVEALASALGEFLADPSTVLVAPIDFSHYLSAPEARLRNQETISALRAFDVGRVLGFGNEHVDAPAALAAVMLAARLCGAGRIVIRADTDSTAFGSSPWGATSYIVATYGV